jgi:Leucine-rich repeat (LRR) protein
MFLERLRNGVPPIHSSRDRGDAESLRALGAGRHHAVTRGTTRGVSDPWESLGGVLPTRMLLPEVAANLVDAAMLCGAITHPDEASSLRRLVISGVKLETLAGVERFPALDELELRNTLTSRLDGIERAPALQHLTMWGVHVRSLTPLSALHSLRTVRVMCTGSSKVSSLQGIERCARLRHLEVEGSALRSLEPISKLAELRVLAASNTNLASLAGIEKLRLTRLDISSAPVADLKPLAKMTTLRWLDISDTRIKDVSPLAKLEQLRMLRMTNAKVRDLVPLGGLSGLVDLAIGGVPVAKAAPLTKLTALRGLLAWGTKIPADDLKSLQIAAAERALNPATGLIALAVELGLASDEVDAASITHFAVDNRRPIANLKDLERMPALLALDVGQGELLTSNGGDGARLRSLSIASRHSLALGHLAHVQELVVRAIGSHGELALGLPASLRSLKLLNVKCEEPLALTPELRTLDAEECRLTKIPNLKRCSRLVHLAIAKSYINDVSPIAGHPTLRSLELPNNRIEDVTPLAEAQELRRIDLDANPVASIHPLARLPQLRWLSLRATPIAEPSPHLKGVEIET